MARALDAGFADIISLARDSLTELVIKVDADLDRAILSIDGRLDAHRVLIKEVVGPEKRRYAYYVLIENGHASLSKVLASTR